MELADSVIHVLLESKATGAIFPLKREKIVRLCEETLRLLQDESPLVCVKPSVKIFGSLYGRFYDLMKIFEHFGSPDETEMESMSYLFLGNYVGKGFNSLETICLLFALKIKYPEQIFLLRGQQEDASINKVSGLAEECILKLADSVYDHSSAFKSINRVFEFLPLAGIVGDKFLCLNSGVSSLTSLEEIRSLHFPKRTH